MKQIPLFTARKYKKRKIARGIATKRGVNHIVLKARKPILRKHRRIILKTIRETQDRFQMRIQALAVMPDHIHLIARVSSREQFANSLRMLAGVIARRIQKKGRLWRERAWSRVVKMGRDFELATQYVLNNPFKARIQSFEDTFWILNGILQL